MKKKFRMNREIWCEVCKTHHPHFIELQKQEIVNGVTFIIFYSVCSRCAFLAEQAGEQTAPIWEHTILVKDWNALISCEEDLY